MQMEVIPGGYGSGRGTYMSLFIGICKGPHDDDLDWPFQQKIILETLDLTGGGQHASWTVVAGKDLKWMKCWQKPVDEDNDLRGAMEFISHTDLNCKKSRFLVDDTIYFRVSLGH